MRLIRFVNCGPMNVATCKSHQLETCGQFSFANHTNIRFNSIFLGYYWFVEENLLKIQFVYTHYFYSQIETTAIGRKQSEISQHIFRKYLKCSIVFHSISNREHPSVFFYINIQYCCIRFEHLSMLCINSLYFVSFHCIFFFLMALKRKKRSLLMQRFFVYSFIQPNLPFQNVHLNVSNSLKFSFQNLSQIK